MIGLMGSVCYARFTCIEMGSGIPTTKRSPLRGSRRYATLARAFLRAFVVLVALQVSGLSLGIASLCTAELGCPATCSDEDEDQSLPCSPFCSTCTCVHARPLGLDSPVDCGVSAPRLSAEQALPSLAATAPPRPEPDRVFRPPRTFCV